MNAAIILCGGMSRRMGRDKCRIQLGATTLLEHVLKAAWAAVDTVLVVGRNDQQSQDVIPDAYRDSVAFVQDQQAGCGPLEGMRVGLESLASKVEFAFVCGCDVPLLSPRFIDGLLKAATGFDAVVPFVDGKNLPLPGVYSRGVIPRVREQLAKNELSLWRLVERLNARQMTRDELQTIEPGMRSLLNVNDPATLEIVAQIWEARRETES